MFVHKHSTAVPVDTATPQTMDFKNKVVVITGASSGIGTAAAFLFAKQSATLVLVARNELQLNNVAAKCEAENGIKPLIIKAELSCDDDVKRIVAKTIEKFRKIDVLVNNAAVGIRGSIRDGIKPYDNVMAVNVRSIYLLTSLATPHLVATKGCIVNVSSVAAFKPIRDADYLPYCISKAALDQLTRCVALELARDGVRVCSVNPGGTRTPFAENAGFSREEVEELYKARDKSYPLGKMAEPEEVADLIVYLASNRARSITGTVYTVDNGETLM